MSITPINSVNYGAYHNIRQNKPTTPATPPADTEVKQNHEVSFKGWNVIKRTPLLKNLATALGITTAATATAAATAASISTQPTWQPPRDKVVDAIKDKNNIQPLPTNVLLEAVDFKPAKVSLPNREAPEHWISDEELAQKIAKAKELGRNSVKVSGETASINGTLEHSETQTYNLEGKLIKEELFEKNVYNITREYNPETGLLEKEIWGDMESYREPLTILAFYGDGSAIKIARASGDTEVYSYTKYDKKGIIVEKGQKSGYMKSNTPSFVINKMINGENLEPKFTYSYDEETKTITKNGVKYNVANEELKAEIFKVMQQDFTNAINSPVKCVSETFEYMGYRHGGNTNELIPMKETDTFYRDSFGKIVCNDRHFDFKYEIESNNSSSTFIIDKQTGAVKSAATRFKNDSIDAILFYQDGVWSLKHMD